MKKVGIIIAVVVLVLVLCMVGLVMLGRHHPMSESNLVGTYAFPAGFPNVTALSDEKYILRREGIVELWDDGKKQSEGKWSIKNGKIQIVAEGSEDALVEISEGLLQEGDEIVVAVDKGETPAILSNGDKIEKGTLEENDAELDSDVMDEIVEPEELTTEEAE